MSRTKRQISTVTRNSFVVDVNIRNNKIYVIRIYLKMSVHIKGPLVTTFLFRTILLRLKGYKVINMESGERPTSADVDTSLFGLFCLVDR